MNIIKPLSEVLEKVLLRIPDYQRGYSWGKNEIEALWKDLERAWFQKRVHFTGVITVNKFSNDDYLNLLQEGIKEESIIREENALMINEEKYQLYNIVDGQQRFTSILILLFCLIQKLESKERQRVLLEKYFRKNINGTNTYFFGYHIDVPSRNYLVKNIFEDREEENEDRETLYTHNLQSAKAYFLSKIHSFSEKSIEDCIYTIENRLKFFTLVLDEELDISMVFETMNFRGKTLSGLERFKNRVLYLLSNTNKINDEVRNSRRKEINDTWLEIYRWLGKEGSVKMTDDEFLKAFWIIQFSNSDMVNENFKSYSYHLFNDDFKDEQSPFIGMDMGWLKKMRKAISLWFFINNPYEVEGDEEFTYQYTATIQRSLYRITHFPKGLGKYMQVLILAILMRYLPYEDEFLDELEDTENPLIIIENLLWHIERHNIICFLLCGNATHFNREKIFRISSSFYRDNYRGIDELEWDLYHSKVEHFNWNKTDNYIKSFGKHWFGWDGISFILKEYEEILSENMYKKDISIKPIYPTEEYDEIRKTYSHINGLLKSNRNIYTYSLGNLLITKGNNKGKSFDDIKIDIQNAKRELYLSEKEILSFQDWTMDTIIERGIKILNTVLKKWEIEIPSEREYHNMLGHK